MTRRRKAWNMSNPLYRYLHGHKRSHRRRTHAHKVKTMARRHYGRRHHRRGGRRGGNFLMKGLFGSKVPFGLLGLIGAGWVYTNYVSPSVPKVVPMQNALTESAVLGGLPAAVGSFLAGGNLGGSSGGSPNGASF